MRPCLLVGLEISCFLRLRALIGLYGFEGGRWRGEPGVVV